MKHNIRRTCIIFLLCLASAITAVPSKTASAAASVRYSSNPKEVNTVKAAASSYIIITNKISLLDLKQSYQFKLTAVGLSDINIIWTSSNPAIASIDTNGKVTGLKAGSVKITAKDTKSKKTSVCTLRIRPEQTDESSFTYDIYNDKAAITGYYPSQDVENLVIPTSLDGYEVTAIDSYVFYQCTKIKSVDLPAALTRINAYAFYGCTGLTSITIPSNVKIIEEGAFASCTKLVKAILPNKMTELGSYIFNNCKELQTIALPKVCSKVGTDILSVTPLSELSNLVLAAKYQTTILLTKQEKKTYNKMVSLVKEITSKTDSDVEKVKKVHDWIILNTEYDDSVNQHNEKTPDSSYSATGVIMNHEAVCAGYAETFQIFMYLSGIECNYITGMTGNISHGWNSVLLNNEWYDVDVTWDDPVFRDPVTNEVIADENFITYQYFLVTDKTMKKDHSWSYKNYPAAKGTEYQYYAYKDSICDNIDELKALLKLSKESKEEYTTILYPKEIELKDYIFEVCSSYTTYTPYKVGDYFVYMIKMK